MPSSGLSQLFTSPEDATFRQTFDTLYGTQIGQPGPRPSLREWGSQLGRLAGMGLVGRGGLAWGENIPGEGLRGLVSRAGKHFPAAPEGHEFTDVGAESIRQMVQYRRLNDWTHFRVPEGGITRVQLDDLLRRAKDADFEKVFVDVIPLNPLRVPRSYRPQSVAELRKQLMPLVIEP